MPKYDLGFHYISGIHPVLQVGQPSGEAGDLGVSLARALSPLFQSQLAQGQEGQRSPDTSITYTHSFLTESH